MNKLEKVSLQCSVFRNEGNIESDMDGEKVLMSVKKGKYYNLGKIGGEIWNRISVRISVNQLINNLVSEYNVGTKECEEQVISFLDHLLLEGLINIE
jgi:hypothetical protein